MQHHGNAQLRAETFRVVSEFEESLRGTGKQEVEHLFSKALGDGAKLAGKRENDVGA
jgi:hypothetical protein